MPTNSVELVITSPLTRALQTAVLGFPQHVILVHYDLREIGSTFPENLPSGDIGRVVESIGQKHQLSPDVDGDTLKPPNWPQQKLAKRYIRTARVQEIFHWIARERPEQTIAVVCHYGIISTALDGLKISPQNAIPIPCHLHPNGTLVPISQAKE